ncbi:hypothetical protein XELAEV_18041595mg [Xenopus laevis]|uniref:Uncharacterized protein n=1 Tax=Xenopus laevis TaxID=8355 RepID=A0A974H5N6_XENLA|nr:hypothetical protein XELAEV_18041595mg [Xenopus laevis]
MYPSPSLLSEQGPSVVPHTVCTPHLPLCLDRVHLCFLILYVRLNSSICGSSFCRVHLGFLILSGQGPSVVPYCVCTPCLPFCLSRVHLCFLILYVPLTFSSVWTGSICGSSFCMYLSPSPLTEQDPSVVPRSVCTPHLPLCLSRVHLWFLILYVPLTFPSVWAGSICGSSVWTGSICGSSFCMYPSPSPLSGQGLSVIPHSVCTHHLPL